MTAPVTAQLILIQGESGNFQSVIDLHSVNRGIGRAANCDIVWGSLQISRQHATLEYMLPRWYIRDTSTNGLQVNGRKLIKNELFALNDADIISFIPTGQVRYRFRYMYNTPRTSSAPRNDNVASSSVPSTSSSRSNVPEPSSSSDSRRQPAQVEARGRPSVEIHTVDSDSDSEDSNHSASLLSLEPPDVDYFSFSGDEPDPLASPSGALGCDEGESSFGVSVSKRKHGESSDSDSNSLDHKKKRVASGGSSEVESNLNENSSNDKSENSVIQYASSSKSRSTTDHSCLSNAREMLTDDQIANCSDLEALKARLRQCMTKLAHTEVQLKTEKFERRLERDEHRKKENDIESLTTAIKEENFKKILELLESELSCSVCNEVFIHATVVDCGHTFCSFCINEWAKKKMECAICRKPFRNRSRHIELENFITRMFESFNEEISAKRKISIKDREEQVKKAEEASRANPPPQARLNHFPYMQQAESYMDFLQELQNFNEILGPRANQQRNINARAAAAERRRSARIQDRSGDVAPVGAANPNAAAGPERRRQTAIRSVPFRGRGRNAANIANPIVHQAPVPAPPAPAAIRHNQVPPIPLVNLDDSVNANNAGANAPGPAHLRFPNQILNYSPLGVVVHRSGIGRHADVRIARNF